MLQPVGQNMIPSVVLHTRLLKDLHKLVKDLSSASSNPIGGFLPSWSVSTPFSKFRSV